VGYDPADADDDAGAYLEQQGADGAAGGVGKSCVFEPGLTQGVHQDVGQRREPQPQLVGAKEVAGGPVGEEVELVLFDTVFHVASGAIAAFVELLGLDFVAGQVGDDETGIGALVQVFGFGDDTAGTAPGVQGAVSEFRVQTRGACRARMPLAGFMELEANRPG
jgi:hypothetical protein